MGAISAGASHPVGTPSRGADESLRPARGVFYALVFGLASWLAIAGAVGLLRALL